MAEWQQQSRAAGSSNRQRLHNPSNQLGTVTAYLLLLVVCTLSSPLPSFFASSPPCWTFISLLPSSNHIPKHSLCSQTTPFHHQIQSQPNEASEASQQTPSQPFPTRRLPDTRLSVASHTPSLQSSEPAHSTASIPPTIPLTNTITTIRVKSRLRSRPSTLKDPVVPPPSPNQSPAAGQIQPNSPSPPLLYPASLHHAVITSQRSPANLHCQTPRAPSRLPPLTAAPARRALHYSLAPKHSSKALLRSEQSALQHLRVCPTLQSSTLLPPPSPPPPKLACLPDLSPRLLLLVRSTGGSACACV